MIGSVLISYFHFFIFHLYPISLFSGPSLENDYGATAMIQQRNMMDYYPKKGKLINIEHARSPLPMSNSPRPTSFKPLKVNLPTVPTDSPGLKGIYFEYKLTLEQTICKVLVSRK